MLTRNVKPPNKTTWWTMDSVNRQTARERPDLLEWRKCQGQAALSGILAIVIGGGLTFAGLSVFPPVPKKYIPLFSLSKCLKCRCWSWMWMVCLSQSSDLLPSISVHGC
ncbi:uncharacterized protein [Montipora foliosa]|uniref:uncharacterized protein isoform X2 n=1 Tax=Montipora foliosa TaxID=591990 RepID=UPI0035F1333C